MEKAKILIVDDDPNKRMIIQNIIQDCGEDIIAFDNGKDALKFLLNQDVAVILLDVNMPVMDGFETASYIRRRKRNELTPIIFITAYSTDAPEVTRGYSLGAVDYLFTPVVPEILRAKIKVFIDLHKMNKEINDNLEKIKSLNSNLEEKTRELEKQKELLEEVNHELESFSYSVSHDLRAPLRHISGFIELLKKKLDLSDEKSLHYFQVIAESAQRMGNLIDDLLTFSRIGRTEINRVSVNFNTMVKEIISELGEETENRKIAWSVGELPQVKGDYSLLRQVWANLISNAVKYSSAKENAEIKISYALENNFYIFAISDNGVGFDMHYYDKLFEVFQRLHTDTKFSGTGIGLANVKKALLKHGGKVWAESEVDKGATFYFSLPVRSED